MFKLGSHPPSRNNKTGGVNGSPESDVYQSFLFLSFIAKLINRFTVH